MVHFSKLKLYGFKSFVDKAELDIGPGLNGIVGPNGCGKSNLVEALRWVMGEKSAKNMRGGGMEDVIFAGTSKRPARNIAEVSVIMNNEDGTAPDPFSSATEIEINRRIEKDKGSQYRVNGKAVRARDVNLLFADTMTGANSPALVSQGRITEIITAKPSDRRRILEESAGISGLHSRRHEAELRLRAAEQNLIRLDDSLGDMRSRLSSLKRQARQAERYKELSDSIRRLDMALIWSEWRETHTKIKQERGEFENHNNAVQSALEITKSLSTQIEDIETTLPSLRKNHMEAQAVLQNFHVSLERLEQDIKSKTKGLQDVLYAKSQLEKDGEFTQNQYNQILTDLETAQELLASIIADGDNLPNQIETTDGNLNLIQTEYEGLIAEKQKLETAIALATQSKSGLETQINQTQSSLDKIESNISILNDAINETTSLIAQNNSELKTIENLQTLEQTIETSTLEIEKLKSQQIKNQDHVESLKTNKDALQSSISAYEGELRGLQSLVNTSNDDNSIPQGDEALLNHLNVEKGYERAISSALGQWISMAGVTETANIYWSSSNVSVPTPKECTPLSKFCNAPSSLQPLLNAIGFVDHLDITQSLSAGQMIVARDGSFMRWDGLIVRDSDSVNSNASIILQQKNRIAELDIEIAKNQTLLDGLEADYAKANDNLNTLNNKIETDGDACDDYQRRLTEATYQTEKMNATLNNLNEKLSDQNSRLKQNTTEKVELTTSLSELTSQLNNMDDASIEKQNGQITALTDDIADKNLTIDTARNHLNDLKQKLNTRTQSLQNVESQIERFEHEKIKLSDRLDEFGNRADTIDAKIMAYKTASADEDADEMRENILSKIADQDKSMQDIAAELETQESQYKTIQTQLREADSTAALARENRARVQANVANAEEELTRIQDNISEHFDISPQNLEEKIYSLFDSEIPPIDDLHIEKENVTRQRDGIGPVNLRAKIESDETEKQLSDMEIESTDLTKAIEQLRGGIAKLNREAKERLAIAFTRVDTHFQKLFAQLFEGGKAYLEMIQSDDPLESGLEIYAEPPGKTLQKLSLLSGGEQTLTAIALIFGMFLTNPSPICVLDEIDAPLDDANVDRVCSLMESISRDTETRFIVITHHRMTMARMDRLYGVTMSERGVSQLVSVDMALQGEMELSESA